MNTIFPLSLPGMDARDSHADGSAQCDFVDTDEQMGEFADLHNDPHRHGPPPMRKFNRCPSSPHDHKLLACYDSDSDTGPDSGTLGGVEANTTASNKWDRIETTPCSEGPDSPFFEPESTSYGAEFDGFRNVQPTTPTTRITNNGHEMAPLLGGADSPLFEPETASYGGKLGGTNDSRPTTPMVMETQMLESSIRSAQQKGVPIFPRANPRKAGLQGKRLPLPLTTRPGARRGGRGRSVEDDPENHIIKDLRVNKSYTWDAIANKLNERRIAEGEPPRCTAASVYSRFVRNAPRIAASKGDHGFNPRDYMHLRQPQNYPPSHDHVDISKKRTRAEANDKIPRELRGNVRQITANGEDLQSPEKAARFMEAVEIATQQFWMTVRDLMEQFTGHVYDPEDLKKHFDTT